MFISKRKIQQMSEQNTVCLDFDGVLAEYSGFKGENIMGQPITGAKEFVALLIEKGFGPIVFTTRKKSLVSKWLKSN